MSAGRSQTRQNGFFFMRDTDFPSMIDLRRAAQWHYLDDEASGALLRTLADKRGEAAPADLAEVARALRDGLAGGEGIFGQLVRLIDRSPQSLNDVNDTNDVDLLVAAAACVVDPDGLGNYGAELNLDDLAAASTLNHADWLQVVTSAVHRGPGAYLGADDMLDWIEEDIDPDDFEIVEHGLGWISEIWRTVGIINPSDRLTAVGAWVLPRAFAARWGVDFDSGESLGAVREAAITVPSAAFVPTI